MRDHSKRRGTRVSAAIIATAVVVAAFVALGGASLGFSAVGQAQKQYSGKIAVCHRGHHTIKISAKAWPAHKRHGDILGACSRKKGKPTATGRMNKQGQQNASAHSENSKDKAKGNGKDNGGGTRG